MNKLLALIGFFCSTLFYFSCTKGDLGGAGSSYSSDVTGSPGPLASGGGGGTGNPGDSSGKMTAGEWNDLEHWGFWNTLMQRDTIKTFPDVWGFHTQNRVSVVLRDQNGQLVHDAKLTLTNGTSINYGVTDNFGKAELFPGLFQAGSDANGEFDLKAEYGGNSFDLGKVRVSDGPFAKTIPVGKTISNILDIMFVVDATGSMGDEIIYLKNELKDVVSRAGSQLSGTQIRMGSVFYRDNGDDYVTKPFPFSTDVNQLSNFINNQFAGGGGDFPEAVDQALDVAVNQEQWSHNAVNRLLFLILDAPAHKTEDVLTRLKSAVRTAQEKGIRIIPVSASGIDHETEFLLRFLSISTASTYVFITNDSGIGNPHLKPTVGDYQVEFLNNLMVRLITKYGQNRN
jgi:hypothetical protein